jgi:hypothetical protein
MELGVTQALYVSGTLELRMSSHKRDAPGSDTAPGATMIAVNADSQLIMNNEKCWNGLLNSIGYAP